MVYTTNWLYIVVAVLASTVLGMVWYSPVMFAKPWMAALGLRDNDVGESGVSPTPGYIGSIVFAAGQAYLLGLLYRNVSVAGVPAAVAIGAAVWFVTSGLANLRIKFFEDRPWSLYAIDEGYTLAVYLVMSLLAGLWL